MSFNNVTFILHKPQLSENIGACARSMKNFNFTKLVVVNPKPIYPNDKILATSVGARDIIKKETYRILDSFNKFPGYIFNLGHGMTPDINPDKVKYLTDIVREH